MGDFDEDPDVGFSQKDLKPSKKAYEVDYTVYSPAEIQLHQDKQIDEVSAVLGQPTEATAILLRHLRWNKERLIDIYMENPDMVLEEAGLGPDTVNIPKTKTVKGFACEICYEDTPGLQSYALKCGHRYCVDCYRQYLAQKIKDEGEAARIQCPTGKCHRIVDSKSLDLLVAADLKSRYDASPSNVYPILNTGLDTRSSLPELTLMTRNISNGVLHLIANMPLTAVSRKRILGESYRQLRVHASTASVLDAH